VFLKSRDKGLAARCVGAWNDFILDEWCAAARTRSSTPLILPFWDVPGRCGDGALHRQGSQGRLVPGKPARSDCPVPPDVGPVFALAQEADVPLCMRRLVGTAGDLQRRTEGGVDRALQVQLDGLDCRPLFSPVFHHFDRLKVALSEGGIGCALHARAPRLHRDRHRYYTDRPAHGAVELFRRHFWVLHRRPVRARNRITSASIGSPGSATTPLVVGHTGRTHAAQTLAGVPDDEVQQIVEHNARCLLNFDADLTSVSGAAGRARG
jgi:hypothetical protein